MALSVLRSCKQELAEAKNFAVMLDKSTDISVKEQVSKVAFIMCLQISVCMKRSLDYMQLLQQMQVNCLISLMMCLKDLNSLLRIAEDSVLMVQAM